MLSVNESCAGRRLWHRTARSEPTTPSKLTMHICTLQCFQWRKPRHFPAPKSNYSQVQEVNFNFFQRSRVKGKHRDGGWGAGSAEDIKGVMYAFSVAGFVTLGTDRWRNCPSFWARSSGHQPPVGLLANQNGDHPWFGAEVFGRVLYWVQILGMMAKKDSWGEGREGHTLIVMVGEYWGDRRHVISCWAQRCETAV